MCSTKKKVSKQKRVVRMDKYCPLCLKSRLRAEITFETITVKCQNPDCIIGGQPDRPPYYHHGHNCVPDWETLGLDIYDLMHKEHVQLVEERKKEYWNGKCADCGSADVRISKSGPWFDKQCMKCGHGSGGIPLEAWAIPEGVTFLRHHHRVREGWIAHPVEVEVVGMNKEDTKKLFDEVVKEYLK